MKNPKTHFDLSDNEFEKQFENGELPPPLFNHEAHLRLAWLHINNYGIEKAIQNIQAQIISFVKSIGEEQIYNKTLTIAAIKVVHHFLLKSKSDIFKIL